MDSINFKEDLVIKFDGVLSSKQCDEFIARYNDALGDVSFDLTINDILKDCADLVFTNDIDAVLSEHFQHRYQQLWPSFDVIDSSTQYFFSDKWHLDGGMPDTLKLFVYLSPVEMHGGNTLIIDRQRTEKLRKAGKLPVEGERRYDDLTLVLTEMGLRPDCIGFNLKAGDVLLFNPCQLAHRCLPPRVGQKRHTMCFHVTPPIG